MSRLLMPRSSFKFPYRYFPNNKKNPYPAVVLTLKTIQGKKRFMFIMDTGSDMMVLPKYMKYRLDIDRTKLRKSIAYGISGKAVATEEIELPVNFCGETFSIRASFTDNNQTPFLLGKEGIFDRFNITFDNDERVTVFEKRK